ncbi:MAG: GDSL-type esterase/lipase family protein, partial [Planctomycetales bacterium]
MTDRSFAAKAPVLVAALLCCGLFHSSAVRGEEKAEQSEKPDSPYVRPFVRGEAGAPAFDGTFSLARDQTIVVLGGTNALEVQRHGYLETILAVAHAEHKLHVRNMAWQADTVYRQQRPRHFYQPAPIPYQGETDARRLVAADTIILWMGQSESLAGPGELDRFSTAYREMLEMLSYFTPRIVLVTPVPFEQLPGVEFDIDSRNKSLARFVGAICKIGQEHKLPVVDLFSALQVNEGERITRNGMHLGEKGHRIVAGMFAEQLGFGETGKRLETEDDHPKLGFESAESLRGMIIKKNKLWFTYWRPTNWAFLYGNRQTVP